MEFNVFKDFEHKLRTLSDRVREDEIFAQNLYAAMCNVRWKHKDTGKVYSCSWRAAGALVASLESDSQNDTWDYLKWYLSGVWDSDTSGYVPEGTVTQSVKEELDKLGYEPYPYKELADIEESGSVAQG